jgi:hypothetical protein
VIALLLLTALAEEPAPAPSPVGAEAFTCLQGWPLVGHTRYQSTTGQIDLVLEIARQPAGRDFPPGTIIQLQPSEAMVKLAPGSSPSTDDWEYLKLKIKRGQTTIVERGGAELKNIAGTCHGCHEAARDSDEVCAAGSGCEPFPDFVLRGALKAAEKDPRCGTAP